jgi:eukaryotic-like serine/threonine-protein kinase
MFTVGQEDSNPQFPLSTGDWERAKAILTLAADLPQQERTRFVETHLANDPTLSTTVFRLLETYDKTLQALGSKPSVALGSKPSVEEHQSRIQAGDQYGKYRILRSLGHGGMGEVFLAEDTLVERRVALKTLVGKWLDSR